MARYLVVAHQTAISDELIRALQEKAAATQNAAFVLLVPATPVDDLIGWEDLVGKNQDDARAISASRAAQAFERLLSEGIAVTEARVVDPSPVTAVGDELRLNPSAYEGVIISTHPPAISRWLKLDVVSRLRRLSSLPITHVTAEPVAPPPEEATEMQEAACEHIEVEPYWEEPAGPITFRCLSCGEILDRDPASGWRVWKP